VASWQLSAQAETSPWSFGQGFSVGIANRRTRSLRERVFSRQELMTDIITWMSFALQVWCVYRPRYTGKMRHRTLRMRVTRWNLGFVSRITLESDQFDIRN
jgi:hypothetical protein